MISPRAHHHESSSDLREAVNQDGSFGIKHSAVSKNPADEEGIIKEAMNGK